jgi:hypothetical protein
MENAYRIFYDAIETQGRVLLRAHLVCYLHVASEARL